MGNFFAEASYTDASHSNFIDNSVTIGLMPNAPTSSALSKYEQSILKNLPCVQAGYDEGAGCLGDTRKEVINAVTTWAKSSQENSPRIFWLHGMAGEGKTTLTTTVASHLAKTHTLGASFFFSRDFEDRRTPHKVFSSITFRLAHRFPLIGTAVCEAMKFDNSIGHQSVTNQFRNLLLRPLLQLKENFDPQRSIVIVLDALDECGTVNTREDLLAAFTEIAELPSAFKILVSSRPERDIKTIFDLMGPAVRAYDLSSGDNKDAVQGDITKFIEGRMKSIRDRYKYLDNDWPGNDELGALVGRAHGLFIWASTAMKFIEDVEASDPRGRLEVLLGDTFDYTIPDSPLEKLDRLYLLILDRALPEHKASDFSRKQFRTVIGAILNIKNPITPSALGAFLYPDVKPRVAREMVDDAVSNLRSVLFLPDQQQELEQNLRLIHPSFSEFVASENRSRRFFLDPIKCHINLLCACIEIFKQHRENYELRRTKLRYAQESWHYHFSYVLARNRTSDILKLSPESFDSLSQFFGNLLSMGEPDKINAIYAIFIENEAYGPLHTVVSELKRLPEHSNRLIQLSHDLESSHILSYHITTEMYEGEHRRCWIVEKEIIIAVVGMTGSGKSTFINVAAGHDLTVVGNDLTPCTAKMLGFSCHHPDGSHKVVLIDTPGFDDSRAHLSDRDILRLIIDWLQATYKRKVTLAGILYCYPISNNRMNGSAAKNLDLLKDLCGEDGLRNVRLVTTMWDNVGGCIGRDHEKDLEENYWRQMQALGAQMARFDRTRESAWKIIRSCMDTGPSIDYQKLIDRGKKLENTALEGSRTIPLHSSTSPDKRIRERPVVSRFRKWLYSIPRKVRSKPFSLSFPSD